MYLKQHKRCYYLMMPVRFEIEKDMLDLRKELIAEWKAEKSFWSKMRKDFDWMIKKIDTHLYGSASSSRKIAKNLNLNLFYI